MKTVSILGAGPIGNYLAFLLSKNFKVEVYEEHKEIGEPVQCAGIVTNEFCKIIKPNKEFLINKTDKARVFAPNGSFLEIKVKPNYIIDRAKFDYYLYKKAKKCGVKYHLGKKLTEKEIKSLKSDYIIGADGPLSKTASVFGFKKNKVYQAIQARIKLKNDNAFEFYPHIKDFAWVVPENKDIVRVGVAARKNAKESFKMFIKKFNGKMIDMQSGLIPIYEAKSFKKKNIFLVGDAAAQVKATTGGGIIPGLKAAKKLAYSLEKKINYDVVSLGIKKDLYVHLLIRRMLNHFSDEDWNDIIRVCCKEKIKKILYEDREDAGRIISKILFVEPTLLKFLKHSNKIFIK